MQFYKTPKFTIFFGDSKNSPFTIKKCRSLQKDQRSNLFFPLQDCFSKIELASNFVFLHQKHGVNGKVIKNNNDLKSIKILIDEGDFLITNLKNTGIGVLTADCLPIIFFDEINDIAAIAHAGWRGSVKDICSKVINLMKSEYKSDANNIKIFFGPAANICCYEVDEKFLENIPDNIKNIVTKKTNNKIYFDLPLFNILMLENNGIKKENINKFYCICTICNKDFCSYRRDKEDSSLQMTIITLK